MRPSRMPDVTLANRYRVLGMIGRGGMGEVLEVEDLLHEGRVLALKRFRVEGASDALSFLRREFLTLAKLRHPNIASVYDFGTISGEEGRDLEAYFTAEFVDGIDLFEATSGAGWEAVYDLLVQVCRGLAYVHSRGIVHRDVKPSNVLVTRAALVKLIDFGLALALPADAARADLHTSARVPFILGDSLREARSESKEAIRGTVHYLAPEVIRGAPIDRRADLYSLGVMAFEVATRRRPFVGLTSRDVIRGHLASAPPRPASVRADVPEALEHVILRLLEKEPEARFSSADQVIRALGQLAGRAFAVETKETKESWVRSGRFVGREAELAALREWYAAALSESGPALGAPVPPPLTVVTGEAGIGKSRLVREFKHFVQADVGPHRSVETIEVHCEEAGRAYGPIAEIVRRLLTLAGPEEEALLGPSAPLVRRFAGAAGAGEPAEEKAEGGQQAARERLRLFDAVVTFLLAATWRRPAVAIVHDLHRADEGTVALLAHVARTLGFANRARGGGSPSDSGIRAGLRLDALEARRAGFLICATARAAPGARLPGPIEREIAALEEEDLARVMTLAPLGEPQLAELATSMVGAGAGLPPDLDRFLARQTGGNPFFLEELMKSLLENGTLQVEGGKLSVGALEAQRAPKTVTDVFRERLGRLTGEEARLLEALAVARRPVPLEVLEAAVGTAVAEELPRKRERVGRGPSPEGEAQRLEALERRGLVAIDKETRFAAFAHDLLRETVYAAIPKAARRKLHRIMGEALEKLLSGGAGVHGSAPLQASAAGADLALLAEHFAEAGVPERAFAYAVRAAREAAALFANDRAIAHYERALALAEAARAEPAALVEVFEALGRTAERVGAHERAAACYREILARPDTEEILGAGGLARIHRRLGETCETRGEYDLALESFGAGIRVLGGANRLASADGTKLRGAIASVYVKLGLYDDAIEFCRSGLSVEPAPSEAAALLNTMGIALSGKGSYDAAAQHFERSLALREKLDEPEEVAKTLNNLGAIYVERGQVGRAIAFFEQALERGERTGDLRGMAETAANLGSAYSSLGDDDRALLHFERGLELRERVGDPEGVAASLNRLGALEGELGAYDAAVGRLERARRLARRLGETRESVATALFGGRLLTTLGAFEEAREALEEAIRLAARFEGKRDEAEGLHLLGRLERTAVREEAAERALNRSLTLHRKLGNDVESVLVTIDIVEVLLDRGDLELARMIREKLDQAARDLRAGRLLAPLELAAGRLAAALGQWDEAAARLERARELAREGRRPDLEWRAEHSLGYTCEQAGAPAKAFSSYVRGMEIVRELFRRVPVRYHSAFLGERRRQLLRLDFQRLRASLGAAAPAAPQGPDDAS